MTEAALDPVELAVGSTDLVAHVRTLLYPNDSWHFEHDDFLCSVRPVGFVCPEQGWRIHISATPGSAWELMDRAVAVLRDHRVAFTFAADLDAVRWLTGKECGRAEAGKVVTVFPVDDAQFVLLAKEIDYATEGLAGPRILSDRPLRPGSLVHYRYGSFSDHRRELDDDGVYRHLLVAPDGSWIAERRDTFSEPAWAPCPLPAERSGSTLAGVDGSVLVDNRFLVQTAVRRSAKGGIYLATDQWDQQEVIVKHGRAHVEADVTGRDMRDRLRNEAELLDAVAGVLPVPRVLRVVSQDGDVFLAEERLPGVPLRHWVRDRVAGRASVPARPAADLARRLVGLLGEVHGAGVVLRDLCPTNVVVDKVGVPRLVDLAAATEAGRLARRAGAPGYLAPELRYGPEHLLADPAEDLFSLGALLFLLATGNDPVLAPDDPADRAPVDRIAGWLQVVTDADETARMLAPAILGLMAQDPAERWSLADAEAYLAWQPMPSSLRQPGLPPVPRPVSAERLLTDGVDALLDSMTPRQERLWPSGSVGAQTDPSNVRHGAAGVLSVLMGALRASGASGRLAGATRGAAHWLSRRDPGRLLPGLYTGRAGAVWALAEAGSILGEPDLVEQAAAEALRLPTEWPTADVATGLAGAGMALLRVWRHTGEGRLLERAAGYADSIAAGALVDERGFPLWPVAPDAPSALAGETHYGFAYGAAGIGYFLLAAGQATGRPGYVDLAVAAGAGLAEVARYDDAGHAWWSTGPDLPERSAHWATGSAGIGSFLLRLADAADQPHLVHLVAAAASAAYSARWQAMPSMWDGLAGDGQFLLDAAGVLGEDRYRGWALDLADLIAVRHCRRDGLLLVPDDTGRAVVADYGTGSSGVLAFLLRLRHGGARPWMLDDLLDGRVAGC